MPDWLFLLTQFKNSYFIPVMTQSYFRESRVFFNILTVSTVFMTTFLVINFKGVLVQRFLKTNKRH